MCVSIATAADDLLWHDVSTLCNRHLLLLFLVVASVGVGVSQGDAQECERLSLRAGMCLNFGPVRTARAPGLPLGSCVAAVCGSRGCYVLYRPWAGCVFHMEWSSAFYSGCHGLTAQSMRTGMCTWLAFIMRICAYETRHLSLYDGRQQITSCVAGSPS
jgi:hypothetical protein